MTARVDEAVTSKPAQPDTSRCHGREHFQHDVRRAPDACACSDACPSGLKNYDQSGVQNEVILGIQHKIERACEDSNGVVVGRTLNSVSNSFDESRVTG